MSNESPYLAKQFSGPLAQNTINTVLAQYTPSDPILEYWYGLSLDTANDAVDIKFRYRENKVVEEAIDPYFPDSWATPERQSKDPFYGPVPNMERMFGPTFDHKEWYKLDQGAPIME